MDKWRATFLGLKQLPRELTAFELEAFFTFTAAERQVIEDRRGSELQLGLALQIGFLRMSRRVLDAVRIVPAVLWCEYPLMLSTYPFKGVTCTFKLSASSTKPCQ